MINKKLIDLINKYRSKVDDLEDIYGDQARAITTTREFIDLIYNYRVDNCSDATHSSLAYFDDVDEMNDLESSLHKFFECSVHECDCVQS